jgi:hypothetical protein
MESFTTLREISLAPQTFYETKIFFPERSGSMSDPPAIIMAQPKGDQMLVNDVVVSDELNTYNFDGEETGHWTDEDKDEFADSHEEDGDWMDGDALASAGWGTDEDYGFYGDDF